METYSYTRGQELGHMLYMKMFHVDYDRHFLDKQSWIQINSEELNHINRLESFYEKSKNNNDWNRILAYHHELDYKYLPHSISEYIDIDQDINIDEFLDGLIWYLRDTDFCSYSLSNPKPKITVEANIVTVVLELGKLGSNFM
jgi:hypothetical protein